MEHAEALQKLGKHKTGVGCLYINKLADVDLEVLKGIIQTSLVQSIKPFCRYSATEKHQKKQCNFFPKHSF
jgi:hypothetical protein